jgi:catechol-2,3-dioxygenase
MEGAARRPYPQSAALPFEGRTASLMKLNHIDLQVADVDAAREFFEKHAIPIETRAPRDNP